jgi:uncharacterized membrane protein HdeD (DUF308 family)
MPGTNKIYNCSLLFVQGMILIVFSFFVYLHPAELLVKLALTAGVAAVCTAVSYFLRYFFGEDPGRFFPDFFTGMALMGLGFMLLNGNGSAREWLVVALAALWVLMALNVFLAAYELKYAFQQWWLSIVTGFISLYIAYLAITGNHLAGVTLLTLIAIQALLLGAVMIWLSVVDWRNLREFKKTLKELREL